MNKLIKDVKELYEVSINFQDYIAYIYYNSLNDESRDACSCLDTEKLVDRFEDIRESLKYWKSKLNLDRFHSYFKFQKNN